MATAISSDEMQTLWRIAEAMNASGDYKGKRDKDGNWSGVSTPEQAFNRILIGRDLGLSPAQAMMGIDLVRGNLQIRAVLLASFVRQSRQYDYKVVKHDERECTLEFFRYPVAWSEAAAVEQREWLGASTFTIEDAAHAKLIRPGSPWETVPRNMVFARAMSNGVKWYCPDLLGGVPVYTEGDDLAGPEGETIGASESDEAPGWKGISVSDAAEVEKVVRRAERLGHGGLTNLAAAQMALNDQPRDAVKAWITTASRALDEVAAGKAAAAALAGDEEAVDAAIEDVQGEPEPEPESPQSEEEGRVDEPVTGAQGYVVPEPDLDTGQGEHDHLPEPIEGQTTFSDPGGIDVPPKVKREKNGGE